LTGQPGRGASKDDWREWARRTRAAVEFEVITPEVITQLEAWGELGGNVLTYMPLADEVDLSRVAADRLFVTRTPHGGGELTVHEAGDEMEMHPFGFLQPLESAPRADPALIDVALVPGLAFDRAGVRLGRGSGYYDRMLKTLRPTVPVVGVTPGALVVERLPRHAHDAMMTHLATEDDVIPVRDDLPDASRRFVAAAGSLGLDIEVHHFPEGTKTSQEAADAIGCPVSAIAKSLVFTVDGEAVVALLPGDKRLDTAKLAQVHGGAKARRADLDTARKATGYAAGGTPPFGHPKPMTVYADEMLRRHELVWAAGGTPTTVFPIALDDLVRLSGATWADLAEK